MGIAIHDVTKYNYQEVLKLKVSKSQLNFIETTYESLVDSVKWKEYKPVGLYQDYQLVGFAMYGFFAEETKTGRLWIDRFLIDENYQGFGLGTLFMETLIQKVTEEYGQQAIYLSVYPENEGAFYLYEKFGFCVTGELDVNGEQIMKRT
ncbi:GNAT family N-acetyltransferase [Sporosarcina sp. CAU 1771]